MILSFLKHQAYTCGRKEENKTSVFNKQLCLSSVIVSHKFTYSPLGLVPTSFPIPPQDLLAKAKFCLSSGKRGTL